IAVLGVMAPSGFAEEDVRTTFRQAVDALEQGDFEKSADLLDRCLALQPSTEIFLELRKEAGEAFFLKGLSSENEDLRGLIRKFLRGAEKGELKERSNPERINSLMEDLKGDDFRQQFLAEQEIINSVGQYVFLSEEIVEVLSNRQKDDHRVRVIRLLSEMGPDAVRPLVELFGLPDAFGRQNVAVILGHIRDRRALPYLKRAWEGDEDKDVKDQAADSIQKITGRSPQDLPASPVLFLRDADRYYYDEPAFVNNNYREWIVWDWRDGKLTSRSVPSYAYNEIMAEELCYEGLKVNPSFDPLWTLLLNTYYARVTEVEAALEVAVEKSARGELDASTVDSIQADLDALQKARSINSVVGAEGILKALARSLSDGRVQEAVAAIRALQDLPMSASLLPTGSPKPPKVSAGVMPPVPNVAGAPMIEALFYRDKRVRYAAANAIVRIRPRTDVLFRGQVVRNLIMAVGEMAPRLVLVIEGNSSLRNRFMHMLGRYHYLPLGAASVEEGRRRGLFFPPEDIFLIGEELPGGRAHELIDIFKSDFRTSHIPILIISDPAKVARAEQVYGGRADGVIPADIDEVVLKDRIDAIFEGKDEAIKAKADRIASEAATSLSMIDPVDTIFDLKGLASALRETLEKRPDFVRIPAMAALGHLQDRGSITALTQILTNRNNAEEARVAAIQALGSVLSAQKATPPEAFLGLKEALAEEGSPIFVAAGAALGKATLDAKQKLDLFEAERID
ncbi:MAG: HEAT repeat domain-containing protein, partial [Planctomycetota bacterium]|nr:HEAT repeat domain-containing protein [Planctomycetota bacterium]